MFKDVPIFVLVFVEAFWYNKMNKYGVLRVQNPEIMEFGGSGVQKNKIGILLYQSEAD